LNALGVAPPTACPRSLVRLTGTGPIPVWIVTVVFRFADGAYDRTQLLDKAAFLDFVIEVVRRTDNDPGFKVLPRRWVVV
jgi:hypothetical protein